MERSTASWRTVGNWSPGASWPDAIPTMTWSMIWRYDGTPLRRSSWNLNPPAILSVFMYQSTGTSQQLFCEAPLHGFEAGFRQQRQQRGRNRPRQQLRGVHTGYASEDEDA